MPKHQVHYAVAPHPTEAGVLWTAWPAGETHHEDFHASLASATSVHPGVKLRRAESAAAALAQMKEALGPDYDIADQTRPDASAAYLEWRPMRGSVLRQGPDWALEELQKFAKGKKPNILLKMEETWPAESRPDAPVTPTWNFLREYRKRVMKLLKIEYPLNKVNVQKMVDRECGAVWFMTHRSWAGGRMFPMLDIVKLNQTLMTEDNLYYDISMYEQLLAAYTAEVETRIKELTDALDTPQAVKDLKKHPLRSVIRTAKKALTPIAHELRAVESIKGVYEKQLQVLQQLLPEMVPEDISHNNLQKRLDDVKYITARDTLVDAILHQCREEKPDVTDQFQWYELMQRVALRGENIKAKVKKLTEANGKVKELQDQIDTKNAYAKTAREALMKTEKALEQSLNGMFSQGRVALLRRYAERVDDIFAGHIKMGQIVKKCLEQESFGACLAPLKMLIVQCAELCLLEDTNDHDRLLANAYKLLWTYMEHMPFVLQRWNERQQRTPAEEKAFLFDAQIEQMSDDETTLIERYKSLLEECSGNWRASVNLSHLIDETGKDKIFCQLSAVLRAIEECRLLWDLTIIIDFDNVPKYNINWGDAVELDNLYGKYTRHKLMGTVFRDFVGLDGELHKVERVKDWMHQK